MKPFLAALLLVSAFGCATGPGPTGRVVDSCANCGTVRGVDLMHGSSQTSGAGAVLGAVIGGVVGHQFGSGKGNDAATAAGAIGGAVIGNEAERQRSGGYYRITVDMDRGDTQSVNVPSPAGLRSGSRVKLVGRDIEIVER
jgi:outer membrane lipoprotein SlyB